MPLYVDLHYIHSDKFTEEDAFRAHLADLNVQDKFGVTHKKFWINFEQKTMFCLVEGPDKEACNAAHQMAHMDHACNIIEVSNEEFVSFLGIGKKNRHDMALTLSGDVDSGYRTLLVLRMASFAQNDSYHKNKIYDFTKEYHGSLILRPDSQVMASFIFASDAISCATSIDAHLKSKVDHLDYTMALVTGKPVDDYGTELFAEPKTKAQYLCGMGLSNAIYVDAMTKTLSGKESQKRDTDLEAFHTIDNNDFIFSKALFTAVNGKLYCTEFKSGQLCKILGLSKAQVYRRVKGLTGMSPNELIREMRLRKSLETLKQKGKTVAEIAYELGFNSPTYFTRVFRKRYKILPTTFAKLFY
ncbi:nickel-binding protein [Maribacter sp. IgM3_T14_3]|uniref:nickel-binding protein n=1 Tax=Maribacter sp. IgM3_T14_3 TaxID=3415140 RepID=UPI003C6FD675